MGISLTTAARAIHRIARAFIPQELLVQNYQILHEGMGFPIGTVVPETAIVSPESHLHIGSIKKTKDPVTDGLSPSLLQRPTELEHLGDGDEDTRRMANELKQARAELAAKNGEAAELKKQLELAEASNAELIETNEKIQSESQAAFELAAGREQASAPPPPDARR